jgi:hypothetical protein
MKYQPPAIKPSDIYPKECERTLMELLAPQCLVIKDFRPPVPGDLFVASSLDGKFDRTVNGTCIGGTSVNFTHTQPRFIVEPAPKTANQVWE